MANITLENTDVFALKPEYAPEILQEKFVQEQERLRQTYNQNVAEKHRIGSSYNALEGEEADSADFDTKDLLSYRDELELNQQNVIATASANRSELVLLEEYGSAFAHLYQIKKQEEFDTEASLSFKEIPLQQAAGVLTQEQYFEMSANPKGEIRQLVLHVELPEGNAFDLMMVPYDKPGIDSKEVKAQISVEDEALQQMNARKLAQILEFCERHGLSTFQTDIPYSFDGHLNMDEKIKSLLEEIKSQKAQGAEIAAYHEKEEQEQRQVVLQQEASEKGVSLEGISPDMPQDSHVFETEQGQDAVSAASPEAPEQQSAPKKKEKTLADAESGLEGFLEDGLRKVKGFSYFKEHTGLLGTGWTEYIVYEKSDTKNRKNDGRRDKSGEPKFTYSFKIFVKQEKGKFRFAYRTPYNKKIDDAVVNGMVGQFKSLGITHVRFPDGLQDAEKKLWRIALAENGIVPVGMGLDRAKAEAMLKAAREKLSTEAYRKFRYRLAEQMDKDNKSKGKVLSPSEQEYIDGLKNSQKYLSFTEGYGNVIKGRLRDYLDQADLNRADGAVQKTGAYIAVRRLFDAYREAVDEGGLLNSTILTPAEKGVLRSAGLAGNVSAFSNEQIGQLYDILLPQSKADAKKEMDDALIDARDTSRRVAKGPKRADNVIIKEVFDGARSRFEKVNEILSSLNVDEISFPKSFGRLHYDNFYAEHPEYLQKPNQGRSQSAEIVTESRSAEREETIVNSEKDVKTQDINRSQRIVPSFKDNSRS